MNVTTIAPKSADSRLKRIKRMCQSLKLLLPIYLGCLLVLQPSCFNFLHRVAPGTYSLFCGNYASMAEVPWQDIILALLSVGTLLAIVFTLIQLFALYQRGVVFSARTVQLLRRIGLLVVGSGLLAIFGEILVWTRGTAAHEMTFLTLYSVALSRSPWVIGGLCVIVLAYIMDEGRKIQEEQELTV